MSTSYTAATSPEVRRRLHRETDYNERRRRHMLRVAVRADGEDDSRESMVERTKGVFLRRLFWSSVLRSVHFLRPGPSLSLRWVIRSMPQIPPSRGYN